MPTIIKPIQGVPGYYVSNTGRVWSKWKTRRRACGGRGVESYISDEMKELKLRDHNGGYKQVALRRGGKYVYFLVHRLVLETFVGPCPEGMEGCHRDGDKHNNRRSNLYWGTKQENADDSVRLDQVAFGSRNSQTKLTEEQVLEIVRLLNEGHTQTSIAKVIGVSQTLIGHIARRKIWRRLTEGLDIPTYRHWSESPAAQDIIDRRESTKKDKGNSGRPR